jgi:hypothetical protein
MSVSTGACPLLADDADSWPTAGECAVVERSVVFQALHRKATTLSSTVLNKSLVTL